MTMVTIIMLTMAIFVIILMIKGITIVQQAETMIIERLGKYNRTLKSGIHVIWPIIEKPQKIEWQFLKMDRDGIKRLEIKNVDRIDLRETVYDFPKQTVITRDNVVTEIDALLYFQITNPLKSVYEITNLPDAIEKLTQTTLRNVIAEMDLDQTLSSRDTINTKLRIILNEATGKWGVKITRVELEDISPPADIRDAMEKQMRAERDKRAVILEAEGLKTSKILEAEGDRESEINSAEGEKKAKILIAEGEAEARKKIAEAEAEAILKITNAIVASNSDPANYLIAIRYIETLKEMVSGQGNKVVYLPYEATGILSSIGGIKEMLTSTSKQSGAKFDMD